jgi:hypothetical protein
MPSTACVLKSSSGSLPDYSFEMHHTDPAAPGHHSTSDGLLPAFKGNTKPLKSRALDQLLRVLMRAMGPRRDHPYRLDFRAAWQSRLWSIQGWRPHAPASHGRSGGYFSWISGGLQGVAN